MIELEERFQEPPDWQWGTITNSRGMQLRYGGLPVSGRPAAAHIVFVEGLGGNAEQTFELSREFNRQAQGFWVLDRAGQGMSQRYLTDRFKMHARDFRDDVSDLINMVKDKVPQDGAPIFLFAHSTGALVALEAAARAPKLFAGVIASGPLAGIQNPIVSGWETVFARLPIKALGLEERYIPGGGPWQSRRERGTTDNYSSDPVRNRIPDYWMETKPELKVGAVTWGWVWQACKAIARVMAPGFLQKIETPVLVLTAGRDHLVENGPTLKALAPLKNAEYHHFPEGKHELYLEADNVRKPYMKIIGDFIARHSTLAP